MEYKTFGHKWFGEVWNKQNESAIFELFSKKGIAHDLRDEQGNEIVGPEKFAVFFKQFIQSFPDLRVHVEDTVTEKEKITCRCTITATHSGKPFQSFDGRSIPPTGKEIKFTGMSIVVVRDGQIQEAWNNFDFLTMYLQLGLLKL